MTYYQCPECGYRQRSKAEKQVKCHRCGRTYQKKDAKTFKSKTEGLSENDAKKAEFHTYKKSDDSNKS